MEMIEFHGPGIENYSEIRNILREISKKIDTPIHFHNIHYKTVTNPYAGKDELHIYSWASIDNSRNRYNFGEEKIFGEYNLGGAMDGNVKTNDPQAHHLKCPEGHVVAEVHEERPCSLYILFDLPHQNPSIAEKQLRGILETYFEVFLERNIMSLKYIMKRLLKSHKELSVSKNASDELIKNNSFAGNYEFKVRQLKLLLEDQARKEGIEKEIEKISKESKKVVRGDESFIVFNEKEMIVFQVDSGNYEVIIDGQDIPFYKICQTGKAGLAHLIGRNQYYTAFKMIRRWIKTYNGGK